MLTEENGVLTRANKAKTDYSNAQIEEKYSLGKMEDILNEYQTGITVDQVTDTAPGVLEGSGTESEPYVINSIEDLVFFAYDVTNGNNYLEKVVNLGLSLDFNSTKSYVEAYRTDYGEYGYDGELKTLLTTGEGFLTIGSIYDDAEETQKFKGTFNGQGNTISNLYINRTIDSEKGIKLGFIANNKGTISNLILSNVNLYLKTNEGALGAVCGQNSSTGKIESCVVSGNINNESIMGPTGGITCYSSGSIKNSINMCDIKTNISGNNDKINCVGGICSNNASTSIIKNCVNIGDIDAVSNGEDATKFYYIGGIIGVIQYEGAVFSNCYNLGNISGSADYEKLNVGGIAGLVYVTQIQHCYNIGDVLCISDNENSFFGAITGRVNKGTIENSYYLAKNELIGIGTGMEELEDMSKTEKEMKSINFVNLLNQNNENAWKQDTNNINNGYPILSWQ